MVRTSDGTVLWTRETQTFEDVVFSPNGKLVWTYTGRLFNALRGDLGGVVQTYAPPAFANDSLICALPNAVYLFTTGTDTVYKYYNPPAIAVNAGEQAQWCYFSSDNYAIILARDMSTPPQTGLAFYKASITTEVSKNNDLVPTTPELYQNYPNPFNPITTVRFSLPKREYATLKIFDLLGREIKTLVSGELDPGGHSIVFNTEELPSGVYFYRLSVRTPSGQAESFVETKKLILMK